MILLDTDVCIAFLNGKDPAVRRFFGARGEQLRLCAPVKAELYFGARSSSKVSENLLRLPAFFGVLESLDFDDAAAEQYGLIRAQLKRAGTPIGPNDLLIAAVALAHDASLATRNVGEFARVPGLRLEAV
jgi:tRNA(fMet)-specific endonuclease VapC